ncbi:MAG TPA: hypothetical protein DHW82_10120 [Spirochaetia bacterium]|nr:MAG: hypothetical protein A2Y41_14195 [Spirochaetes bacterium GWB1_36_13]HCL57346.1 hypothetical protein [Spirochaetia bacterium]
MIFLLFFQSSVFSQEKGTEWETSNFETQEIQTGDSKKSLVIKNADQIYYSEEKDSTGYTTAELYGNVYILYEEKRIFADEITIKFFDQSIKELVASGNIIIETDKNITIGKLLFLYPETKKGLIYSAETYNKPYFIRGEYFKFLGENKLIVKDTEFTNCEFQLPHYALGANKSWIYKDDMDMFFGFHIKVGEDPIFYFPFMYRSYYGTGLITALGNENGVGFFLNNTYQTKGQSYTLKLMIDHYQKTGEYLGLEHTRSDIGTLTLKTALVYDRHVKYEGTEFKNFFEEVSGEGPVSGRSLRYKMDIAFDKTLLSGDNFLGLTTSIKGSWFEPTDPYLTSQFESRRMDTFDIKKILFPEDSPSSLAGSFASGSGLGRKMDFAINSSFLGFTLSVTGNLNYNMSKTDNEENAKNRYKPDYYKNYKSSSTFPSINISRPFSLFDPIALIFDPASFGEGNSITFPFNLSTAAAYTKTKGYDTSGKLTSETINESLNLNFTSPLTFNFKPFSVSLPFGINNGNQINYNKSYSNSILSNDYKKNTYTFTFNSPFNFAIDEKAYKIAFNFPVSTSYTLNKQKTAFSTSTNTSSLDASATYNSKSTSLGGTAQFDFFKEYEYLLTSLTTNITYSSSEKYGENIIDDIQKGKTKNYTYTASLSFLKSSFSLSTSSNLSDNTAKESRKGPLNLNFSTSLIPNITIQDSFSYDRFLKENKSNNLSINSSIATRIFITDNFWINSLSFNTSWNRSYQDYKSNYLSYSFSMNFNYTKFWQFSLVSSGSNNKLYYYTKKVDESIRRDFWKDLYKSVKLWSIEDRQNTYFKMSSFGFNIKHDLHKWMLELSSTFTPKIERNGAFYFESSFLFKLTLTELPSLNPTEVKKTFGQQ